jgi:monoterpene epsilon-lactone hydrolase
MLSNIVYIHNHPQSLLSTLIIAAMSVAGMKNGIRKTIENNNFQSLPAPVPKSFYKHFDVNSSETGNRKYWIISPKINPGRKVVFYVHGGAYITNIITQQWEMVETLILKTNATFVVPDYETAPFGCYSQTNAFIDSIYKIVNSKWKPENIILMGDSAGAGFLLGYLMTMRNIQQILPSQIILLSPWLDITMQNPEIQALEKYDKMLASDGLIMAGKLFAGDMDTADYRLSPIHGDFKGLCEISIFTGSHDILHADCLKLKTMLSNAGVDFNYFEYPGMFHDWMIFRRLKEAEDALKKIGDLIENS